MEIQIKIMNVTGDPSNDCCIFELKRCGFPVGSIINNPSYNKKNKSFWWTSGGNDCVAYLGETCKIIKVKGKQQIKSK